MGASSSRPKNKPTNFNQASKQSSQASPSVVSPRPAPIPPSNQVLQRHVNPASQSRPSVLYSQLVSNPSSTQVLQRHVVPASKSRVPSEPQCTIVHNLHIARDLTHLNQVCNTSWQNMLQSGKLRNLASEQKILEECIQLNEMYEKRLDEELLYFGLKRALFLNNRLVARKTDMLAKGVANIYKQTITDYIAKMQRLKEILERRYQQRSSISQRTNQHHRRNAKPKPKPTKTAVLAAETENDEDDQKNGPQDCSICMDEAANCAFLPCGHVTACYGCAKEVEKSSGRCPICRDAFREAKKLFF